MKGHFVEEKGQFWRSSFEKQNRPDQDLRTRQVLPMNRLVRKGARYLTTDTSTSRLQEDMKSSDKSSQKHVNKESNPQTRSTTRFSAKNT